MKEISDKEIIRILFGAAEADRKIYEYRKQGCKDIMLSNLFYEKMDLIKQKFYKKQIRDDSIRSAIGIAASIVLIFALLNPTTVADAAKKIWNWGKYFVDVQFFETSEYTVIPKFTANYIPSGYKLDDEYYDGLMSTQWYEKGDDTLEINISGLNTGYSVNSENVEKETFYWNGHEVNYLKSYEADYYSSLFVIDEKKKYIIFITGPADITKEDFLSIVEGITIEE